MILIVEDDPAVSASLKLLLKGAGYQTSEVSSPEEVLYIVEHGNPELVLMDMNFSVETSDPKPPCSVSPRCNIKSIGDTK